jgi:hypothetical protein
MVVIGKTYRLVMVAFGEAGRSVIAIGEKGKCRIDLVSIGRSVGGAWHCFDFLELVI